MRASTHALARDLREIDAAARARAGTASRALPARSTCSMVPQQPVAVLEHDAVELAPLVRVELARLQRLEIQPNRRDRRLQLVGDRVDERVVLLVPPDLAHQEDRVQHDAGDDEQEEDDAEDERAPPSAS